MLHHWVSLLLCIFVKAVSDVLTRIPFPSDEILNGKTRDSNANYLGMHSFSVI
jgi:hypothetical protein